MPETRTPAFYALRPGGWRDYWTLLHPPYTLWHLANVALGASAAPVVVPLHLGATLLGFFLGVGITAHALDELNGRPLRTRIPKSVLHLLAWSALAAAIALGIAGAGRVSWWMLTFVAFGGFIVVAYNLELFGGALHSDLWFAVSWGVFPALTGTFAQTGTLTVAGVLLAAACGLFAWAQRWLSTPVRMLRRRTISATGKIELADGTALSLDEEALRSVPEGALRICSAAMVTLAAGAVAVRLT